MKRRTIIFFTICGGCLLFYYLIRNTDFKPVVENNESSPGNMEHTYAALPHDDHEPFIDHALAKQVPPAKKIGIGKTDQQGTNDSLVSEAVSFV